MFSLINLLCMTFQMTVNEIKILEGGKETENKRHIMWLSDMLVTLKAGNGSVNFPKAFGAPDRKGCLWALLAGCSLSYSDLPLEIYTCFTSDWMLQCMCIYFILCEHPSPKLCRMTNLGRRTSLHVCSGLQLLSGWKWCVDFDPRTVSVLWNYEGKLYQNSTEMKCYMPGDIQRSKKVRGIQWKTFSSTERHSENKEGTWAHATY